MANKLYVKIKNFIKENYSTLLVVLVVVFLFTFKLPYYISAPGGLINTTSRLDMTTDFKIEGSLNMAYVTEYEGIIPMLLVGLVNKNWDIMTKDEVTSGDESIEDVRFRNKLLLEEANSTALLVAYKNSEIKYKKENSKSYVTYVDDLADTNLKVGDEIVSVDGTKIKDKKQINEIIEKHQINDKIDIIVNNDNKEQKRYAKLIDVNGKGKVGVLITETYDLRSDYNIDLTFKASESGSSGGLMLTLTLYSYLNKLDLTSGKKIVGTGTIDENGNVGEISGIKYKLIGAVKRGADVFIVPRGENYDEALKVKKEKGYDIPLVPVSTFEEAVDYLLNM